MAADDTKNFIYIFLEANPFPPSFVNRVQKHDSLIPVRRPMVGLSIQEETHATLQIIAPSPRNNGGQDWVPIINSSAGSGGVSTGTSQTGTSNFIIVNVTHPRREKFQIVQSFSDEFLYLYGEEPKILDVQGVLLKSKNFNWRAEWLRNYEQTFRASQAVDRAAQVFLTVEDTVYQGHMLACQVVDQADQPLMCPMQFTLYLTDVTYAPGEFEDNDLAGSSSVRPAEILNSTGGKTSRKMEGFVVTSDGTVLLNVPAGQTRSTDPFRGVDYNLLADQIANFSGIRDVPVDPFAIRRAGQLLELRRAGFGLGDGENLGSDALRLERLFLRNGVGGYASQIDTAGSEFNNILDEFGNLGG